MKSIKTFVAVIAMAASFASFAAETVTATALSTVAIRLFVQFGSHMHAVAGKRFSDFVRRSAGSLRLCGDFRFRAVQCTMDGAEAKIAAQAQAAGASSYKITEAFTGNRVHMTAELNK